MSDYIRQHAVAIDYKLDESWIILSEIEQSIKKKIEAVGTPLKDWNIKINRGILTGLNEAFIISKEKRDELIKADPKSAEIIRPILRGRDIKRYSINFANLYLIYVPWHFPLQNNPSIVGASKEAESLFKKGYPAIYNHLYQYKDKLSKRNRAETGKRYEWYALQRYGAKYMDDFSKPKILYSEIVTQPQFYLDVSGKFIPEATSFLITGSNIETLIKYLNSKVISWIFQHYYAGGGLGSGFRYKKAFIEQLCIPNEILTETVDKNIDIEILSKYEFNHDEKQYIKDMIYFN